VNKKHARQKESALMAGPSPHVGTSNKTELPATKRPTSGQRSAAEEPDTHEVEWLNYSDRTEARAVPLPRSLANLKREISKKWVEARQWAGGRTSKTDYRTPKSQRPDGTVAGSTKRLASRFYQIRTGHCLSGAVPQLDEERAHPAMLVVPVPEPDSGAPLQGVSGVGGPTGDSVGGGAEGDWEGEGQVEDPGPPGGREVRAGGTGLPLRHGCGEAGAGRGDAVSEVSEAELREFLGGTGGGGRGAGCWGDSTVPAHVRLHFVCR